MNHSSDGLRSLLTADPSSQPQHEEGLEHLPDADAVLLTFMVQWCLRTYMDFTVSHMCAPSVHESVRSLLEPSRCRCDMPGCIPRYVPRYIPR